jgi:hypothetical protein
VDRVTVPEAAHILGIKEESVRKRVSRGTLRSEKDATGRLLVWADGTQTVRDESVDQSVTDRDELLESKDEIISILRDQLSEERDARRRADTILAQLTQATSNLTDRLRELEAPADAPEPSQTGEDGAQEPAEAAPMPAPAQADTGAQDGSERVSWWRRLIGG